MSERPMRQQAAATVVERFVADPAIAVVLAEISADLFAPALRHDPHRAVNVGIMEQTMVGVAAGFALEGLMPVVHTIAPFLAERSLEQLKLDFGYQRLPGLFVGVGGSYDYAESGMTHHSPGDVAAVSTVPGMRVVVPGAGGELDVLVRSALHDRALTYVRTSTAANAESRALAPGGLTTVRRGGGPTVVAVGPMLDRTLEATADLDVTVLYATTVVPLDAATLRHVAGAELVVVEPFYEGTLAREVTFALSDRAVRLVSVGVPREVDSRYGTREEHDRANGLDTAGVRHRLLQAFPGLARRAA
jgi:transketolase